MDNSSPAIRPGDKRESKDGVLISVISQPSSLGCIAALNRPIIAALPPQPWWGSPPYTTFTAALVLLGLSAATMGPWVERRGARVAAKTSARFFASGLTLGGLGLLETNGHQNYRNWESMRAHLPAPDAAWTRPRGGVFELDADYYARSGGVLAPLPHHEKLGGF